MKKTITKTISTILIASVVLTAAACSPAEPKTSSDTSTAAATESSTTSETTAATTEVTTETTIDEGPLYSLEYGEFPTQPYNVDKVHPVRSAGAVMGDEAVAELNDIEWDYMRHVIGSDYVKARWAFSDLEKAGLAADTPSLGHVGPVDKKTECEYLTGLLERLYNIDFENLEKQDRDFYDQIVFDIEEERYISQYTGYDYMLPAMNVTSLGAFYATLGYIDIRNKMEAEEFMLLLRDIPRFFDEVMEYESVRRDRGFASIDAFYGKSSSVYYLLTQDSQTRLFREMIEEKIGSVKNFDQEFKDAYMAEFDQVMEDAVKPEFMKCCKTIAGLDGNCKNEAGLAGFEHGKELYEYLLRKQIGRDFDIDKLIKEIEDVLKQESYDYGDPVIEGSSNQEMLDIMEKKAAEFFPDHKVSYTIVKLPKLFKQVGIAGAYPSKSFDDTSEEVILLPDILTNKEVAFHEGIPGHMFQFNYHKTHLKHVYMLFSETDVYAEGWATYIMNNPASMYGYNTDSEFLYNGVTFRHYLTQARADISINYEGMTYVEAEQYLNKELGITSPVMGTDMTMQPALGIAYGLGAYKTLKTMETIKALDPDMDLKTMHTLYLDAAPGSFDRILASAKRELEGRKDG